MISRANPSAATMSVVTTMTIRMMPLSVPPCPWAIGHPRRRKPTETVKNGRRSSSATSPPVRNSTSDMMLRPIRMEMTANEPMHSPKDNSTIMVSPFGSSASERCLLVSFFCLCCKEDVKTVPPSQCGSDLVQDPNRPFTLITHISAHHHTIDASRICDIGLGYSKPSHTHFDCLRHIFIACHITSNPQIFGTPFDNYRIFGNTPSI